MYKRGCLDFEREKESRGTGSKMKVLERLIDYFINGLFFLQGKRSFVLVSSRSV